MTIGIKSRSIPSVKVTFKMSNKDMPSGPKIIDILNVTLTDEKDRLLIPIVTITKARPKQS